jgi:serine O-acetyltransferase
VLIGHKSAKEGKAAIIGNNVFIGTGTKIIGDVHIGDNVTIGQNCVITKDIPSNSIVVQDNRQLRWL